MGSFCRINRGEGNDGAAKLLQRKAKHMTQQRPPLPPFSYDDALTKVRRAEDAWNGKNPVAVSLAYSEDSRWRNRNEFLQGRAAIVTFLERKWARELDYRLIKEIWAHGDNR